MNGADTPTNSSPQRHNRHHFEVERVVAYPRSDASKKRVAGPRTWTSRKEGVQMTPLVWNDSSSTVLPIGTIKLERRI